MDLSDTMPDRLTRPTREETQATTRRRLLDAATAVFVRDGFHAASVHAVAEHAGYSSGAVYSNFPGKDALFLAVFDRHIEARSDALGVALVGAHDVRDLVERVARWFASFMDDTPAWPLLAMEVTIRARRSPELAEALAHRHRATLDALADALEHQSRRFLLPLPRPPHELAAALFALGHGLVVHQILDPSAPTRQVFTDALITLLGLPSVARSNR
ncbi:MAG: TetR/AcrR family transcriptional regulator [Acidimicrobiales bacterium]